MKKVLLAFEYLRNVTKVRLKMLFSKKHLKVLSQDQTISEIRDKKKSLARFGDGEFALMHRTTELLFQKLDAGLATRLREVLVSNRENCLIGLPDTLWEFTNMTFESKFYWYRNMHNHRDAWMEMLSEENEYVSANITRFYMRYKNKKNCAHYYKSFVSLWDNKDVLLVEGIQSRVGVGNPILNNATSVKRIVCPSENAFEVYDKILEATLKHGKDKLILIALGPTATVLAYDLACADYWALDVGHFDLEYEWFARDVKEKTLIDGKYVNEKGGASMTEISNEDELSKYKSQIVAEVLQ